MTTYNNGRSDFLALCDHYEGIGVNALDINKVDRLLDTYFYSGEKRPHMWWGKFERLLNEAFSIYNKRERQQVHSEHMKLPILCRKVQAGFLQSAKAVIQLDLTKVSMTLTYYAALASFCNQVNLKFPPEMFAANNRNRNQSRQRNRNDARMVRCLDGSNMEVHPSYKFSDD